MTQTLNFERAMQNNATRQRLHEKKQDAIAETNAKLRFAAEEKAREEAKQKTIADAAAHILAKNNSQEAAVAKKRHNVWLHTIFPAKHAGIIAAKRNARSPEAISHTEKSMRTLHGCGKFNKRISLDDPWQPDISLLQLFGSWPNVGCIFSAESRPQVRCSPQLATFLQQKHLLQAPEKGARPGRCTFESPAILFCGPLAYVYWCFLAVPVVMQQPHAVSAPESL